MDFSQICKLATEFPTSSFAIWKEDETPEQVYDNICKEIEHLKNNVILLGLNRAGSKGSDWGKFYNFHAINHEGDSLLSETVGKCSNLKGAYMTDLSEEWNSESSEVSVTEKDLERLKKQFEILGGKEFFVICFGRCVCCALNKDALNKECEYAGIFKEKPSCNYNISKQNEPLCKRFKFGEYTLHCFYVMHYSYPSRAKDKRGNFTNQMTEVNRLICSCSQSVA